MNLIHLYRYLRNYITITVAGGFSERFFNLCNKERIYLWDTVFDSGEITTNLYCSDFRKLLNIRRKSGVAIRIRQKHGLAFLIKKHRNRKMLAVGLILSLTICVIMNQFVWSMEIIAPDEINVKEIYETVKSTGLKNGAFVKSFDEKNASRQSVNMLNGKILWMAINIKGSKATIEVRNYEDHTTNKESDDAPCNIIANADGLIISSEISNGIKTADRGTAVKKGDMLVSGISINEDGSVSYMHSEGKITATSSITHKKNYTLNNSHKSLNESYTTKIAEIFNLTIPLSLIRTQKNINTLSYSKIFQINNVYLPFSFNKQVAVETEERNTNNSEILYFIDKYTSDEYEYFKNSLITDAEYKLKVSEKIFSINSTYNCINFIGEKSYIEKEN